MKSRPQLFWVGTTEISANGAAVFQFVFLKLLSGYQTCHIQPGGLVRSVFDPQLIKEGDGCLVIVI
jgi:hypothetical protein